MPRAAVDLRQQRTEGMAPVDLVAPVGAEHAQTVVGPGAEQVAHQRDRRRRRPVQIVEHQHHRSVLAGALQQAVTAANSRTCSVVGSASTGSAALDGEGARRPSSPPCSATRAATTSGSRPQPERAPRRKVGTPPQVPRRNDRTAPGLPMRGRRGRRGHEAGLSHPGFAGHQHRPALTRRRRLPRAVVRTASSGPRLIISSADDAANAAGNSRVIVRFGIDADRGRGHRLGDATEHQLSHRVVVVPAAVSGQHPHHVGGQDLVLARRAAQPTGCHHRRPEHVAVLLGHITDRHPDAEAEGRHLVLTQASHCLLEGDRRGHRLGGAGEGRQTSVAHRSTPSRPNSSVELTTSATSTVNVRPLATPRPYAADQSCDLNALRCLIDPGRPLTSSCGGQAAAVNPTSPSVRSQMRRWSWVSRIREPVGAVACPAWWCRSGR